MRYSTDMLRRLTVTFGLVGTLLAGCGSDQGGQGTSTTPSGDQPGAATTAPLNTVASPTPQPASAQTAEANMTATNGTGDGATDQGTDATPAPTERPASAQTAEANMTATSNAAP